MTQSNAKEASAILNSYLDFSPFLVASLGLNSSVVVFSVDRTGLDGAVIGLFGPTGKRAMGDPMTPLVKRVLQSLQKGSLPHVIHVDTEASTTEGRVKLSFYPIRGSAGQIIGLYALSLEIDLLYTIRESVNQFLAIDDFAETRQKLPDIIDENLSLSQYMQQLIQDRIDAYGVPVERMTMEEKREIVHQLERLEVFYVKDSVRTAAVQLGISVPTVYRLLK